MVYNREYVLRKLRNCVLLLAGFGLVCPVVLNTTPTWAQSNNPVKKSSPADGGDDTRRRKVNVGTVTVMTGGIDGISQTYYQLAKDMADVLDVRSELRILPVIGYGSMQNIEDLLYLKGIDFSMVNADVMRHMEQKEKAAEAKRSIRYITKLYDQSLHVIANKKYNDIKELNGKTVIIGRPGTGNEMSALTLIKDLGLEVNPVHVEFEDAVEQLRKGDAAAMIVVARKPSDKLRTIVTGAPMHFLPVPMPEKILETYDVAPLTAEDYPNLIKPGTEVLQPRTSAVLAVYNWKPGTSRYVNVVNFITALGDNLETLGTARAGDIWQEMDVVAEIKGWQRFEPAETLVKNAIAARSAATASAADDGEESEFAQFAKYLRKTMNKDFTEEELQGLFGKFKAWGERRSGETQ